MNSIITDVDAALRDAQKQWGWFLALGVGLIVLGALAIVYEEIATLASVSALGIFLIIAGVMQLAAAFMARGAGHVVLSLLFGALEVLVGLVVFTHPVAGALLVTLTLAIYLIFSGLFRLVYSLWAQMPHYGWAAFGGVLALALGVLLWIQWPSSAVWFLGFAVGVNLLFGGIAWAAFALKLRSPLVPIGA